MAPAFLKKMETPDFEILNAGFGKVITFLRDRAHPIFRRMAPSFEKLEPPSPVLRLEGS